MTIRPRMLSALPWCGSTFCGVARDGVETARLRDTMVTTLDDKSKAVNFEVGHPVHFDGEEFARTGRIVPVDGPGEPTGVVTIASIDRGDDITPTR